MHRTTRTTPRHMADPHYPPSVGSAPKKASCKSSRPLTFQQTSTNMRCSKTSSPNKNAKEFGPRRFLREPLSESVDLPNAIHPPIQHPTRSLARHGCFSPETWQRGRDQTWCTPDVPTAYTASAQRSWFNRKCPFCWIFCSFSAMPGTHKTIHPNP